MSTCRHLLLLLGLLSRAAAQFPCQPNALHEQGAFQMNLGPGSLLGNDGRGSSSPMDQPCRPGVWAPQLEYPAGSGTQYLYQASLWLGAMLEEDDGSWTPRVSYGSEGWTPDLRELFGPSACEEALRHGSRIQDSFDCEGRSLFDPQALADRQFTFSYADTLTRWIEWDHRPLGLDVRQQSFGWGTDPDYNRLLFLRYEIRNIGPRTLHSPVAGLFVDSDVYATQDGQGALDDLVTPRPYAYSPDGQDSLLVQAMVFLDNDGRRRGDLTGSNSLLPAALAVLPLGLEGRRASFNWWQSNREAALDFGPAWSWWEEHPEFGLDWTDSLGTPVADLCKYQLLGNGEWDPAYYAGQDGDYPPQPLLDESGQVTDWRAWNPPDPALQAMGGDVRGLLGVGPLGTPDGTDEWGRPRTRLEPGQSVELWFALVLGDNLHQTCCPQPDIAQRVDHGLFDFRSLDRRLRLAHSFFEAGFPPLPLPPELVVEASVPGLASLSWTPRDAVPGSRYRLERERLQSGEISLLAEATSELSWWEIFTRGDSLLYRISEIWPNGLRSVVEERLFAPDYPPAVGNLQLAAGDGRLELSWDSPAPQVLIVHGVMPENPFRTEYCWPPACPFETDSSWLPNSGTALLEGLENLRRHFVRVHAVNDLQLASTADWHSAVPASHLADWRVLSLSSSQDADVDSALTRDKFQQIFAGQGDLPEIQLQHLFQTVERSQLDGARTVWLDGPLRYSPLDGSLTHLDLLHLQEGGARLVLSSGLIEGQQLELPLDPFNSAARERRKVPASFGTREVGLPLAGPWSLQVVDPVWGELRAGESGSHFFQNDAFLENEASLHTGRFGAGAPAELQGEPATLTFADPFVHLMRIPVGCLDVAASRSYLDALLDFETDLEPASPPLRPGTCLLPCAPNPFNPLTRLSFELAEAGPVRVRIHDLRGALVRTLVDGPRGAGRHSLRFDGSGLASGVYFYTLEAAGVTETRKMVLMK